jgi:ectoine hydroxylase-related dioxygenase (phytanoyl-CoA dioxygenase family)
MDEPGPYASENVQPGAGGRFFDDYCNWNRIPEFEKVIRQPAVAQAAAALMRSERVQMFHEHVLVKEAGTSKATPWHQDSPYYFVQGRQTVSFWSPLDPVSEASLRCVAGHIFGRSRFFRPAGFRKAVFIQIQANTCPLWSRGMRWRSIF